MTDRECEWIKMFLSKTINNSKIVIGVYRVTTWSTYFSISISSQHP